MTPPATRVRGFPAAAVLLAFGLLAAQVPARAQNAQPAPAATATGYQDRVIEGLAPSIDEDEAADGAAQNPAGWARSLRFETRLGHESFQTVDQNTSLGVALSGQIETPSHGVLSLDAQRGTDPAGGLLTLRQRGLPLGGGWRVNNELGAIGSLAPTLTRQPSRVSVPGQLIEGGSTEWLNAAKGLQLQAASGQPARLEGLVVGRLRRLPGTLTSLGAQLDTGGWSVATRTAQARQAALTDEPTTPGDLFDADSALVAVRRESASHSAQVNVVHTRSTQTADNRSGAWLDTDWNDGARRHSAGLFWLEPDLTWAGQPMASDVAGGYVRSTWNTREWSTEGALDLLRSVSSRASTGAYASGSARWRFSRRMSLGAGAAARNFNGRAWNTFGDVRWLNDWGSSSLRLDLARELAQSRSSRLTLDHEWPGDVGWSLATSLFAGRVTSNEVAQTVWGAAASLNAPLSSSVTASANLTLERASPGDARTGLNAGLNWRLTPRWSLDARYTLSRGRAAVAPVIDPLAPPVPFASSAVDIHSVFVLLRWEDRAGTRSVPLGGRPQDGGGRVEGVVFLDSNRSGIQEAGEAGAPGVTVMLDGLYTTRTDAQGRFEFPLVASGERTLTVLNETLPLPWLAPGDARRTFEVQLRDTVRLAIPVTRQGAD